MRPFTTEEAKEIQDKLNRKLDPSDICYRSNGASGTLAYLEGWRAISHANDCFGFNGWSSSILHLSVDYCDASPDGRVNVGMACTVRVWLRDGTFHEDVGYGIAEGMKSKGAAFEKARKEAVTDATKRALRSFGDRLGNCAYDKEFLKNLKKATNNPTNNQQSNQSAQHLHHPPNTHQLTSNSSTLPQQKENNTPNNFVPKWTNARQFAPSSSSATTHHHHQHHPPSDFDFEDFPMFEG